MKQGKTLQELAAELERQASAKRDFIAPIERLQLIPRLGDANAPAVKLALEGSGEFPLNNHAHGQLAEFTGIPKQYYDRCLSDAPELLARQVNRWLPDIRDNGKRPTPRLVRTLDGIGRGFLSNGYQRIENYDMANAIFPVLAELEVTIVSCEITERNFYVKCFDKRVEREILAKGTDPAHTFLKDVVSPALCFRNSEVGAGRFEVATAVYTGGCTNFAIFSDRALRRYHIGSRVSVGDEVYELLTDKTKQLTDEALLAQMRDVTRAAFSEAKFEALIRPMQEAADQKIGGDVVKVVEAVAVELGISKAERSAVLKHLIEGGNLSKYGLFNAVTRTAQDAADYDRATELEAAGAQVIELPRASWEKLAKAA